MKKIYFNTTERGLTISFLKKLLTGQNVKNKSENTNSPSNGRNIPLPILYRNNFAA
jgi:hypothetical protein